MINSILIYILSFVVLVLIIWIIYTEARFKKFFAGTKAKDLEEVMTTINKQMEEISSLQIKINKHLSIVDKRLDQNIRNIETIRFNPFGDAGSNQSFAMSFLNDEGNGVIVSSLYARDRMSIFAKPIKNGKSDFDLSNEEKEVLNKSIKK
jgi:predicted PurR-regulated permease PerM